MKKNLKLEYNFNVNESLLTTVANYIKAKSICFIVQKDVMIGLFEQDN